MFFSKLNKIITISCIFFIVQCYKTPFFEITVETLGQDLNPIANVLITIEVTDVDSGNNIDGSVIYLESTTNNNGVAEFSFDKKAFVSARACWANSEITLCKEGHVYLEENTVKNLSLMLDEGICEYCDF